MRREFLSFVLPLVCVVACTSGPEGRADGLEPEAAANFAPAPAGEIAAAPAVPEAAAAIAYAMTDALEFACTDAKGRRVEVGLKVVYATAPQRIAEAQNRVLANRGAALAQARATCNGMDFADEDCLVDCEHKLMGRLGEAMFGDGAAPVGEVTRIVWSRVLYR